MDTRLQCSICKKTFTQKSSLVRHSKRCTPGPAPSLRQKSCRACTASKTKCDLQRPRCGRCEQRDTPCKYIIPLTRGTRIHSPDTNLDPDGDNGVQSESMRIIPVKDTVHISFAEVPQGFLGTDLDLNVASILPTFNFETPEHPATDLIFDYNPLAEKDPFGLLRWPFTPLEPIGIPHAASAAQLALPLDHSSSATSLDPANPAKLGSENWVLCSSGPGISTSPLVKHSMETLLRVFKTWPKMLAKGFQTPPMFHFTHVQQESILPPLSKCVKVAKFWAWPSESSAETVRQTITQEMRLLFEQYLSMDERHLLSALQALIMYTVMVMVPGREQISVSLVDPAIFLCLQKVIFYVARTGLMLTEERDNERPSWASWVHVTAKRRAVFSLYLLHWSYSVYHGLESFACSQIGFMPAPAPKFLWQAETQEKWEELYDRWLGQWGGNPYMMREFAEIRSGTALERRSEQWLEDADELGVLFFTIGTTVHPCVKWW